MEQAPVLVIGYNRLDLIKDQINFCVTHKRKVIISIDGPRDKNDLAAINVADYVQNLKSEKPSWLIGADIRRNNLGCRLGVSTSISDAFRNFDSLIILEDDVICHPLFFSFMDLALERFRFNQNIFAVNSWNPLLGRHSKLGDVFLSRHFSPWGWGTWKDRWAHYDVDMSSFNPNESVRSLPTLTNYNLNYFYERLLKRKLVQCHEGYDTWDYQFMYAMWKIGAVAANSVPRLSGNTGFDERATHTKQQLSYVDAQIYGNSWSFDGDSNLSSLSIMDTNEAKDLDHLIDRLIFGIETKSKFAYLEWACHLMKKLLGQLDKKS